MPNICIKHSSDSKMKQFYNYYEYSSDNGRINTDDVISVIDENTVLRLHCNCTDRKDVPITALKQFKAVDAIKKADIHYRIIKVSYDEKTNICEMTLESNMKAYEAIEFSEYIAKHIGREDREVRIVGE